MRSPVDGPGHGPGGQFLPSGIATRLPRGWIDGFVMSLSAADTTNDITILQGECRSTSNIGPAGRTSENRYQRDLELPASINKQLDVAWAPANGASSTTGMRSSAAISNATWHIFAIGGEGRKDDIFAHTSADPSSVLPAGYTAYRRVGSIIRGPGSALLDFSQVGDEFLLTTAVQERATTLGTAAAAVTQTLTSVPSGIRVTAILNVHLSNAVQGLISPLDVTDVAPSLTLAPGINLIAESSSARSAQQVRVRTNTSAQIRLRTLVDTGAWFIHTVGWVDQRGRNSG